MIIVDKNGIFGGFSVAKNYNYIELRNKEAFN